MDVTKALRFTFDDKQWIAKLLIGVVLSLFGWLIVPAFVLMGYVVKLVRQVMNGQDTGLPEWTDWGELLKDGFFVTVAQFIFMLPFLILIFIVALATGGMGSLSNGNDALAAAMSGAGLLMFCLVMATVVALLFLMPALMIQYARTDDFGALFRFNELLDIIRNHAADILITVLVSIVIIFVVGTVSAIVSVVPCLGWIVGFLIGLAAGPYVQFVSGHLYGQIGAKVLGNKSGGYYPPVA